MSAKNRQSILVFWSEMSWHQNMTFANGNGNGKEITKNPVNVSTRRPFVFDSLHFYHFLCRCNSEAVHRQFPPSRIEKRLSLQNWTREKPLAFGQQFVYRATAQCLLFGEQQLAAPPQKRYDQFPRFSSFH